MLGLPKATELNKKLPKTAVYAKFQMDTAEKAKIDADISRITIVNEVSASKVNIAPGEKAQAFFVLQVVLKRREFNERTLIVLSKLIPQNMVLLLEYDGLAKLAVYHTKLLQTPWKDPDSLSLAVEGLTMDAVWENVIVQIGGIQVQEGNTLDQQIAQDEQKAKLEKEIARLQKQLWAEKQPKKKFELNFKIKELFADSKISILTSDKKRANFWKFFAPFIISNLLTSSRGKNFYSLCKNESERQNIDICINEIISLAADEKINLEHSEILINLYNIPSGYTTLLQNKTSPHIIDALSSLLGRDIHNKAPFLYSLLREIYNKY